MPDKQKVTLYLSDDLHRQFKIRSAVDGETMSSMAQKALEFYLSNAAQVENSADIHGHAHQVHSCPQCSAAVTLREESLTLVATHAQVLTDELMEMPPISSLSREDSAIDGSNYGSKSPDEGELITC